MKPGLFEKIIRSLVGSFHVVLLEDYLSDPSLYQKEKNLATVCFDDGYRDNIEKAAPILLRHSCPASFYVVTDCIDRNVPTWTFCTDQFFQQEDNKMLLLKSGFVPGWLVRSVWSNVAEGKELGKKVKPWMKSLSNEQRVWVLQQMEAQNKGAATARNMMMSWSELNELHSAGFYIGSHAHSQPMLASLASEEEILSELVISAEKIQKHLGFIPLSISYPNGSYDQRVIAAAAKAGYQYGLAKEQRFFKPGTDHLFAIPRVELYQEAWWKARLRISGQYQGV